ncbi:MAG: hypothetical protein AB7V13_04080 [Pseudorhodoplanes sp.]|uniref:hypothetical protein n=1 Tax=Pseudorhodoplanes sp. TaxID=1934341 RepID=UPI003D095B6A
MHILMLVGLGVAMLAVMHFGPRAAGLAFNGAWYFIWLWLVISIANGIYGHLRVGIPLINEIAAFLPIFGIPAALAWWLMYRG